MSEIQYAFAPGIAPHPLGGEVEDYIDTYGLDGAFGLEDGKFVVPTNDGYEQGGWIVMDESYDSQSGIMSLDVGSESDSGKPFKNKVIPLYDLLQAQAIGLSGKDLKIDDSSDDYRLLTVTLASDEKGEPYLQATVSKDAISPESLQDTKGFKRVPLAKLRELNPAQLRDADADQEKGWVATRVVPDAGKVAVIRELSVAPMAKS